MMFDYDGGNMGER